MDWKDVEAYLKQYVGECYDVLETADEIYIGNDFPSEVKGSEDTIKLRGTNAKAKANAYLELLLCEISGIGRKARTVVDEIKAQINKTPHRFIRNEEFAEKYGWSVRTITSKFKESTGTTIHAWQMEQKCRSFSCYRGRRISRQI